MNAVIGMTELILDTDLSAEQRSYLNAVAAAADLLLDLLNDILDFSKIEAGQLHIEATAFDLIQLLDSIVDTFAHAVTVKGLQLITDIHPSTPAHLIGDPTRLRQIVLNLVSNAIKFTHQGEIRIRAKRIEETEPETGSVHLHIAVEDTGIGIPTAKQARIFDAFVQADHSVAREYGGTGLGLSIAASLARLMDGQVELHSEPGIGSRFELSVRLASDRAPERRDLGLERPLEHCRVLIAELHRPMQRALSHAVRRLGGEASEVYSRAEAQAALSAAANAERPFHLLLEAIEPEESKAASARAPGAILISAPGSPTDEPRRVTKPIRSRDLENALLGVLKRAPPPHRANLKAEPSAAVSAWRILLVEDNPVNQRVATALLKKMGHQVRVANHGQEAINLILSDPPDLVLMDVEMPEMDGLEATRRIRALEQARGDGPRLPIIALTAHAMKGHREQFLAAGMDAYASKPIRSAELHAAIAAAMAAAAAAR
jgi:CheY-like chemotaxis protein/two-component sensor histidine kinase